MSKGDGALVRVHALHDGQGLEVVALFAQGAAALLESALHGDVDAINEDLGIVADNEVRAIGIKLGLPDEIV